MSDRCLHLCIPCRHLSYIHVTSWINSIWTALYEYWFLGDFPAPTTTNTSTKLLIHDVTGMSNRCLQGIEYEIIATHKYQHFDQNLSESDGPNYWVCFWILSTFTKNIWHGQTAKVAVFLPPRIWRSINCCGVYVIVVKLIIISNWWAN